MLVSAVCHVLLNLFLTRSLCNITLYLVCECCKDWLQPTEGTDRSEYGASSSSQTQMKMPQACPAQLEQVGVPVLASDVGLWDVRPRWQLLEELRCSWFSLILVPMGSVCVYSLVANARLA